MLEKIARSGILAVSLLGPAQAETMLPNQIDLYQYTGKYPLTDPPPELRPIQFVVPPAYRFGSTKNASNAWNIELLTFYPAFEPAVGRSGDKGLNCSGICNGRILITIEYRPNLANTDSPNMGDFVARTHIKLERTLSPPPNVSIKELEKQNGFDGGFEKITSDPTVPLGSYSKAARKETVLFRKAPDGVHYDLAATCEAMKRTTCILHFSLSCNPALYVSVHGLDETYLEHASDIADKTDVFVKSLLKEACKT